MPAWVCALSLIARLEAEPRANGMRTQVLPPILGAYAVTLAPPALPLRFEFKGSALSPAGSTGVHITASAKSRSPAVRMSLQEGQNVRNDDGDCLESWNPSWDDRSLCTTRLQWGWESGEPRDLVLTIQSRRRAGPIRLVIELYDPLD